MTEKTALRGPAVMEPRMVRHERLESDDRVLAWRPSPQFTRTRNASANGHTTGHPAAPRPTAAVKGSRRLVCEECSPPSTVRSRRYAVIVVQQFSELLTSHNVFR